MLFWAFANKVSNCNWMLYYYYYYYCIALSVTSVSFGYLRPFCLACFLLFWCLPILYCFVCSRDTLQLFDKALLGFLLKFDPKHQKALLNVQQGSIVPKLWLKSILTVCQYFFFYITQPYVKVSRPRSINNEII